MTATMTIKAASRRLGVKVDTAKSWLRDHAVKQNVIVNRGTSGLVGVETYVVPVAVVNELRAAVDAWEQNPTIRDVMTALNMTVDQVRWLIRMRRLDVATPPAALSPHQLRITRESLAAYQQAAPPPGKTVKEVMGILGVSKSRVEQLVKRRRLVARKEYRPMRITEQSIAQELARRASMEGSNNDVSRV